MILFLFSHTYLLITIFDIKVKDNYNTSTFCLKTLELLYSKERKISDYFIDDTFLKRFNFCYFSIKWRHLMQKKMQKIVSRNYFSIVIRSSFIFSWWLEEVHAFDQLVFVQKLSIAYKNSSIFESGNKQQWIVFSFYCTSKHVDLI